MMISLSNMIPNVEEYTPQAHYDIITKQKGVDHFAVYESLGGRVVSSLMDSDQIGKIICSLTDDSVCA